MKKISICIDLDNTVCENKIGSQTYADVKPFFEAVEKIKQLRKDGHYVILQTARGMRTYAGNEGKVLANRGPELFEWLKKWGIEFDEIYFGKPDVDCFVDDKSYRHTDWESTNKFIDELIAGANK